MTAISITPGYPNFSDTDGSSLNDGYVYIGLENQDPITAPTGAFWDKAFQVPADQPLRTSGGYIVRNGTPAAVYTGASYSILVQNKNLVTVYNAPSAVITNVTNNVEEITQYQGAHATDPIARNDGTPLEVGDLYFNTVINELKVWTGSAWVPASPGAITVQNFTGTGAQTGFNLASAPVSENNTQIYIDGVYQQKDTYTVAGATINFSTAPPYLSGIEVVTFSIAALGTVDASNVSYNQGGAGAVNQSVQSKLQESVSVKDFGAVGDGVTDDTAAIQAALDYARDNNVGFVSAVDMTAGTYLISSTLNVYDNCMLFSSGDKATIKVDGMSAGSYAITTAIFRPIYLANFLIHDTASSKTVHGIYIGGAGGSSHPSLSGIECIGLNKAFHFYDVHDSYSLDGLGTYGCVQDVILDYKATSLKFTNCNFEQTTGTSIEIDALASNSNCGFYYCVFSQNPSATGAVTFQALSENALALSIENCRFERTGSTAGKHINITGSGGVYPSYVNIINNYFTGLNNSLVNTIEVSGIQGLIQGNHFKTEPTSFDVYVIGSNNLIDTDDSNTVNQARTTTYVKYSTTATLSYNYLNASPVKIIYRNIALPATATGYTETAITLSSFGHLPNITMPTRITRYDLLWNTNAYGVEDLKGTPSVEITSTDTINFKYDVQTAHGSGSVIYDLVVYGY